MTSQKGDATMFKRVLSVGALFATTLLGACDDDGTTEVQTQMFDVTIANVSEVYDFLDSGAFSIPVGESAAGPLFPGGTYEASLIAAPGSKLSFVTMFVQSNDFFYAPAEAGIDLFDGAGNPLSGDVTSQLMLWDAGTEIDEEPGLGGDQAPRQAAADTGADDPDSSVRLAADSFGNLPPVGSVIRATIEHAGGNEFTLRIENVSTASTLSTSDGGMHPVPLSPGVFVVHTSAAPLFQSGRTDSGMGLEAIAEDGDPAELADALAERTGLTSPLAPGVWAVHGATAAPIFTAGSADRQEGLESLAEDADPSALAATLQADSDVASSGVFNTPDGASSPGPILPGNSYSFQLVASPGDRLSFATMLGQSNDLFYAPMENGIALFSGTAPVDGDLTNMVDLWDAGTEVNEAPGAGPNQAPRQAGPDSGTAENGTVMTVSDGYSYPPVDAVIAVTISPVP